MANTATMLLSWEGDGQTGSNERAHYTFKGVVRRIRKLQRAGKRGYGEIPGPNGGYVVAVETIPGSWA